MLIEKLPTELLDEITLQLHKDGDVNALRDCSRVCHELLPVCQKWIFQTITLTPYPEDDDSVPDRSRPLKCDALFKTLRGSPHLAGYIKSLRCIEGLNRDSQHFDFWNYNHPDSFNWLTRPDSRLPSIIMMLRNLEEFDMRTENSDEGVMWHKLPERLREALLALFEQGTLREVGVFFELGKRPPMDFYRSCRALTTLRLASDHKTKLLPFTEFESKGCTKRILHTLRLIDVLAHGAADWLLSDTSPVDITKLETLSLIMSMMHYPYDHSEGARIVRANAKTLRRLSISPSNSVFSNRNQSTERTPEPISLGGLDNLRVLRFRIIFPSAGELDDVYRGYLGWLNRLLTEMRIFPHMEEISLYCVSSHFMGQGSMEGVEEKYKELGWKELDEIVSVERFPRLRALNIVTGKMNISLNVPVPLPSTARLLGQSASSVMVNNKARGVLNVSKVRLVLHEFRDNCD